MTARSLRLAVLCSFNLDFIQKPLQKELQTFDIEAELYFSGYGQWETETLNPDSGLYRFAPTVVVLFIDLADVVSPLHLYAGDETPIVIGAAKKRFELLNTLHRRLDQQTTIIGTNSDNHTTCRNTQ